MYRWGSRDCRSFAVTKKILKNNRKKIKKKGGKKENKARPRISALRMSAFNDAKSLLRSIYYPIQLYVRQQDGRFMHNGWLLFMYAYYECSSKTRSNTPVFIWITFRTPQLKYYIFCSNTPSDVRVFAKCQFDRWQMCASYTSDDLWKSREQ